MSELMNNAARQKDFHWQLLTTVSAFALIGSAITQDAQAQDDADRPTVWIELGGQLEHIDGSGDRFTPDFMLKTPTPGPFRGEGSPIGAQRPARYSYGAEGKLTFQPESSDWIFSASVRYGRSKSKRYVHQQTETKASYRLPSVITHYYPSQSPYITKYEQNFTDNTTKQAESHLVLDFQAGHDVGLGMFGREGTSVLSAGVRFAQFTSSAVATIYARPHVSFYPVHVFYGLATVPQRRFMTYTLRDSAERSFHGVGPSLSWSASAPFAGNRRAGELSFDWGLNGAILFGRQKAHVHQNTLAREFREKYSITPSGHDRRTYYVTRYHHTPPDQIRSHSVVVPNLGVKAAISYNVENFKATLGYRADFFFGAVDAGIDARRTTDLTFHGPFASVSLGL